MLNHTAGLHLSQCAIFLFEKVCHYLLSMLSKFLPFNNSESTEKYGSFDIWDLLSFNRFEPGVPGGKGGLKNKKIKNHHEVE